MDENKTETQVVENQAQAVVPLDVNVNPQKVIENAAIAARALKDAVDKSKNKSIIRVNGQEYLMFPAWQTIGEFYGYTAQIEWTKKLEKDREFVGYEAKAVLINLRTGKTFPGAEALCLANEQNWKGKPEFTLKSMAQTRACSKTLSNRFRWVATLAGYEGTPGEEMSAEVFANNIVPQIAQYSEAGKCPIDHDSLPIMRTKKEGKNFNRAYRVCPNKNKGTCSFWRWAEDQESGEVTDQA